MTTIHVKDKFTYTAPDGERHDFAVGSHVVDRSIAEHPFVRAHLSDSPIPVVFDDPAKQIAALTEELSVAAYAVKGLTTERDTLSELVLIRQAELQTAADAVTAAHIERDQLAAERDTQISLNSELFDKVAALTAERDALGNQVAELQAGGTSTGKKK